MSYLTRKWVHRLAQRAPRNKLVVAIANKLARIAWGALSSGQDYQEYGAGTVDQHATQINVTAFADAEQLLLTPVEYCGGLAVAHPARLTRRLLVPTCNSIFDYKR